MRTTRLGINWLTTSKQSLLDEQLSAKWRKADLYCSLEWAEPWSSWAGSFLVLFFLRMLYLFLSIFFLMNCCLPPCQQSYLCLQFYLSYLIWLQGTCFLSALSPSCSLLRSMSQVYAGVLNQTWPWIIGSTGLGGEWQGPQTTRICPHLIRYGNFAVWGKQDFENDEGTGREIPINPWKRWTLRHSPPAVLCLVSVCIHAKLNKKWRGNAKEL